MFRMYIMYMNSYFTHVEIVKVDLEVICFGPARFEMGVGTWNK